MGCACESHEQDNIEIVKFDDKTKDPKIISKIISIQSLARGHLTRKQIKSIVEDEEKSNFTSIQKDIRTKNSIIEEEQITKADINYLFNKYPPLNDDIEVELLETKEIENGILYYGEWDSKGNKHGRGIKLWPNGTKYIGYLINNKANIRGKLIYNDGDIYEGEWNDDKEEGYGKYTHIDGAIYEGYWKDDKLDGKGKEIWPDGNSYEGDYVEGNKNGHGKFIWSDGSVYEGDFVNNNIDGKGIYKWPDGRQYEGSWKENQMHGYGVFSWPDGRMYKGEYKNDKKEGYGVFRWKSGEEYRGFWKNGKQNGEGEMYYPDKNKTEKHTWKNGKKII